MHAKKINNLNKKNYYLIIFKVFFLLLFDLKFKFNNLFLIFKKQLLFFRRNKFESENLLNKIFISNIALIKIRKESRNLKLLKKNQSLIIKQSEKYNSWYGWKNNLILCGFFFLWFWMMGIMFNIVPMSNVQFSALYYLASSGHINNHQLHNLPTTMNTLFLVANITSCIFVSFCMQNYSVKKIVCIAYFCAIFMTIGLMEVHTPKLAKCFSFLYGLCAGVTILPMLKLANQWFAPKQMGKAMSISIGIALLGTVISGVAASYGLFSANLGIKSISKDLSHFQYNINSIPTHPPSHIYGTCLLISIFILILLFISGILFIKEKKKEIGKYKTKIHTFGYYMFHSFLNWDNIKIFLIIALINLPVSVLVWSQGTVFVNNFYSIIKRNNHRNTISNWIMIGVMIGNIIGSFVWGSLTDYIGKRKGIFIFAIIIIIIFSFLTVISKLPIIAIFIIYGVIGFLCSSQNIGYPIIGEQNASKLINSSYLWNSLILLALGAIISQIYSHIEAGGDSSYNHTVYIMPVIMIFVLLLSLFILETGPKASKKNKKIIQTHIALKNAKLKY